jgi:carbamoyltransferase
VTPHSGRSFHARARPADLDAVAYSYDPARAPQYSGDVTADGWEGLRTLYAQRAPLFLRTALPGLDPAGGPVRRRGRRHALAAVAAGWAEVADGEPRW